MTLQLSRILSAIMVIILGGVITSAVSYQFITGLNPCPLCFLQRACMGGLALSQLLNLRFGVSMLHYGLSLFQCVLGGAVALRQTCIHICQKAPIVGEPVFGFSLYVWSFIVFVCSVILIGFLMMIYDPNWEQKESRFTTILSRFAAIYLLLVILTDMVIVGMVCGFGPCPDN